MLKWTGFNIWPEFICRNKSTMVLAVLGILAPALPAVAKATISNFNPGGVYGTDATAINDAGTITGDYGYTDLNAHGFVRAADGTITTFDRRDRPARFPRPLTRPAL